MLSVTASGADRRSPSPRRRIAAAGALGAGAATAAIAIVTVLSNLFAGLITVVGLAVAVGLVWQGALQSGRLRVLLFLLSGAVVAVVLGGLAAEDLVLELVVVLAGVVVTAARRADRLRQARVRWRQLEACFARPASGADDQPALR